MPIYIAGVDGCPAGWIAVIHELDCPASAMLRLFTNFNNLLEYRPVLAAIAVDIPIGLPDHIVTGGRAADREARAVLGQRQSAVFAVPSRAAVMCTDYRDACAMALATSDPPRKVSRQAFNIFAKIREVDVLMSPELQARIFETHPEVAFWALNGERPLDLAKKVKSRPNPPGLDYRRALLRQQGYPDSVLLSVEFPKSKVGPDDILDACVNAWSAARIRTGKARRFPCAPGIDGKGLRMEIWG
ncbi:MAG: DUF429 domain-containing protein [Pseudomonadota bacterium]